MRIFPFNSTGRALAGVFRDSGDIFSTFVRRDISLVLAHTGFKIDSRLADILFGWAAAAGLKVDAFLFHIVGFAFALSLIPLSSAPVSLNSSTFSLVSHSLFAIDKNQAKLIENSGSLLNICMCNPIVTFYFNQVLLTIHTMSFKQIYLKLKI